MILKGNMRKIIILFSFLIYFSLSAVIKKEVSFKETGSGIDYIQINTANTYIVKATFDTKKYLYIYPEFDTSNKGVFKIFFKKYSQNDEVANILDSEFYTLEALGYIFVPLLSLIFLQEKFSKKTSLAIVFIVCGIIVFYL